jgi:predicted DCC family thiol-disulfide oxidoreductase YuxK
MDPDAFEFLSCHSGDLAGRFPAIEKEACLRAMHLVLPDGTVLVGERAFPEILRRLRRYRWCASLFRLPGAVLLSGAFYRRFAKRRHRAAGVFFPAGKGRDREIH